MFFQSCVSLLLAASYVQYASAATVLAHFMVANSYAYNMSNPETQQWEDDMAAAKQMGVDGFALNWASPECSAPYLDWMEDRIDLAFTAAEAMDFKLVYSFDMGASDCEFYWNQTFMASMINKYAGSSAMLRWNTNIVVTTFGGDTVDQYGDEFFAGLKTMMKNDNNAISLVPGLTSFSNAAQSDANTAASNMLSQYPSMDGFLNC